MAGILTIEQGGKIRANFKADANSTWVRGQVLTVGSTGNLTLYNGETGQVKGLAMENCVTSSAGNPKNDTNVVVQGQAASVLLDEAIVVTDNLSGTGGWTQGVSQVYAQPGGNLTYSATSGVWIGTALNTTPSSNGLLRFLFKPSFGFVPGTSGVV